MLFSDVYRVHWLMMHRQPILSHERVDDRAKHTCKAGVLIITHRALLLNEPPLALYMMIKKILSLSSSSISSLMTEANGKVCLIYRAQCGINIFRKLALFDVQVAFAQLDALVLVQLSAVPYP